MIRTVRTIVSFLVAILWSCQGTVGADEFVPTDKQRAWWSFQPLAHVEPRKVPDDSGTLTDIDRFIRAELNRRDISPSPPAAKTTLLRRIKFALTGLPPTPEEIDSFIRDDSKGAFARVVNRLLASPHYGEHWGRQWLDVVRYSDYRSPQKDSVPEAEKSGIDFFDAYRYRDWVVAALNRDMPFDQFIVHQIAGDRLASESGGEFYADGLIATTVLTIGVWDRDDADKEKVVSDIVDDQINLVGEAFLGITLACARCHDHKFDPISTEDYYGLAGIFYSTRILESLGAVDYVSKIMRVPLATAEYVSRRQSQLAQIDQFKKKLEAVEQEKIAGDAGQDTNNSGSDSSEKAQVKEELQKLEQELLPAPPTAMAALDGGTPGGLFPEIGDVSIHIAGRYDNLGQTVTRHMPTFFCGHVQPSISSGSGRLELARWIASADNPLTARVIVNRIWQGLFGRGLVRTTNNFGLLGEEPSHPQLLDWLARRFIEDGWSVKQLIRTIANSRTYQQACPDVEVRIRNAESSNTRHASDPDNRWLARFEPRRLRAEEIRDSMLSVTRSLDPKLGGPASEDLHSPRRSLYIQTLRADRRNFSTLFDAANPSQCVGTRNVSTIGPQALFFLNDKLVHEQARLLAKRLAGDVPNGGSERIRRAYLLLYGREPDEEELSIAADFISRASERNPDTAWSEYAHVLLCTNEFCYVD